MFRCVYLACIQLCRGWNQENTVKAYPCLAIFKNLRLSMVLITSVNNDNGNLLRNCCGGRLMPLIYQSVQQMPPQLHCERPSESADESCRLQAGTPHADEPQGSRETVQLYVCRTVSDVAGGNKMFLISIRAFTSVLLVCAETAWHSCKRSTHKAARHILERSQRQRVLSCWTGICRASSTHDLQSAVKPARP